VISLEIRLGAIAVFVDEDNKKESVARLVEFNVDCGLGVIRALSYVSNNDLQYS
jgi:hypothetical protein